MQTVFVKLIYRKSPGAACSTSNYDYLRSGYCLSDADYLRCFANLVNSFFVPIIGFHFVQVHLFLAFLLECVHASFESRENYFASERTRKRASLNLFIIY